MNLLILFIFNFNMKNFILKLVSGFFLISTFLFGVDRFATYGLSKSKFNTFKDLNDLYANRTKAEIVLLGSSRTYVMMNPIILDSVLKMNTYNLGQDGAGIYVHKAIFSDVITHNKNTLKKIIHNIDLTTLLPNKLNYSKESFYPHLNNKNLYNNLFNFDRTIWKYKYLPMYKFQNNLAHFGRGFMLGLNIKIQENYNKLKGYKPRNENWNSDFDNYKNSLTSNEIIYDETLIEDGFKIIESLINETARMKIDYCFVFSPLYTEMYNMQLQNKMLISRLQGYADKFEHVSFYDYSNLPMNTKKSYFYNSYHLNSTGADIFSGILAND